MERKTQSWLKELKTLCEIAKSQPHAAYAAFTHGLCSKWNYALRVTNLEVLSGSELLQPLETAVTSQFIPALTGQSPPGDSVRKLLAFPARLGGMGLINPVTLYAEQHSLSKLISSPLVDRVINQTQPLGGCHSEQQQLESTAKFEKQSRLKDEIKVIRSQLPSNLQRCIDLSQEKGASSWLTALPIDKHGFTVHKSAFRDALPQV